jgi:hypothetical protein
MTPWHSVTGDGDALGKVLSFVEAGLPSHLLVEGAPRRTTGLSRWLLRGVILISPSLQIASQGLFLPSHTSGTTKSSARMDWALPDQSDYEVIKPLERCGSKYIRAPPTTGIFSISQGLSDTYLRQGIIQQIQVIDRSPGTDELI